MAQQPVFLWRECTDAPQVSDYVYLVRYNRGAPRYATEAESRAYWEKSATGSSAQYMDPKKPVPPVHPHS